MTITYAKAGVDIEEGDRFVRLIKRDLRTTFGPRVLNDIGGFGAFFDGRFRGMKSPVLVSSVDGVGTKLLVAQMAGRHDTVGQDLVNHCVNDILVCGARPLFFLDYFATGKLRAETGAEVISGFTKACRENGCALLCGETVTVTLCAPNGSCVSYGVNLPVFCPSITTSAHGSDVTRSVVFALAMKS